MLLSTAMLLSTNKVIVEEAFMRSASLTFLTSHGYLFLIEVVIDDLFA